MVNASIAVPSTRSPRNREEMEEGGLSVLRLLLTGKYRHRELTELHPAQGES